VSGQPLMPEVGQRVQVDLSGMQTAEVTVPTNTFATGIITHKALDGRLTIRLDAPVAGHALVTAPADRIRAVI
jgi:hypothetical protein